MSVRVFLAPLLLLAACSKPPAAQQDLDALDRELTESGTANARDPALTASLADQILVDPGLAQSSNANAVRPPSRPDPLAIPPDGVAARSDGVDVARLRHAPAAKPDCPECRAAAGALTLGELANRQTDRSMADCAPRLGYSATWANRLPAAVPLYPDARVMEAAGADGCGLRVVSFMSGAAPGKVVDWYYTRVTAAGYSAERKAAGGQDVLGGTHGGDAYMLYVTARPGGGSAVDLVSNAGN